MAGDKSSHASVHSEVQGAPVMLELTHNKGPADPASLVNKNDGGVTADEELDAIGLGRYHYIAGVICGLANAADAVELNAISYIILQLKDVSGTMKGVVSAAIFAGMLIGGLSAGFLSDKYGRLPCLLISLAVNCVFGFISSFTSGWMALSVCRIIAGVGVGGSIPTVFTLYMEYLPVYKRGQMLSIVASFWMVGSVYAAGAAWIIMGKLGLEWRIFSMFAALPALIALVLGYLLLGESPRFLYSKGNLGECKKVLVKIAKMSMKPSSLASGGHLVRPVPRATPSSSLMPREETFFQAVLVSPMKGMLSPQLRRTSILLIVVWFTLSFGWYGLSLWIPSLFEQANIDLDVFQDAFVVAAANLPGNVVTLLFLEKLGRKRTLWVSMTLSSCLAMLFAFSKSAVLIITVASALNCISTCGWNALDCLSTESFPTNLRTSGMGILAAFGRIGSVAGQLVFGWLINVSVTVLLVTAACCLFVGSAASALLPRETTDQQLVECVADLVLDSDGPFPVDAVKVEGRYTDSPPSPEVSPTVVGAAVVVSQRNAQGEDDSDSLLGAQRVAEPERL